MARNEVKLKMGLDASGVKEGLVNAGKSIADFSGKSLERLKKVGSFMKGGLVMKAIGGIKDAIADMTEMKRAADRLGVSTEMFQKLSYAAEQSGVSTDRMADAMKDLDVKLQDGILRGGSFAELMGELGLDMQKVADMPADQRMLAFADAIQGASGSLSRFGADEFGDAMFEMLPLLEKGSAGIMELGNQATIVSDKHLNMAEDAQQFIDGTFKNLKSQFAIWVAEGIKFFQGFVAGVTQAVLEVGTQLGNVGDIIKAALTLDWDGVKRGFDNISKDATGAWGRIEEAYGDYASSVEDKQKSLADGQKTITDEELKRTKINQDAVEKAEKIALKTVENINKAKKKAAEDEEKAEKDRITHIEKLEKLNQQAAQVREDRDMSAMTAQERLLAIQTKIGKLQTDIEGIDTSTKEGQILKAQKLLELEKLITDEGSAQVGVAEAIEDARDAAIDAQMKGLELERAIAEAMGDNERVSALDRQIERQSMINELVQVYDKESEDAKDIVDAIIARKDEQKRKELEVIRAQADGNDMMAIQLQNQIDKHEEINRLVDEFGIGTKEATALVEKLAKIRFGPDLNQSGFVTPREQREFERQQKERDRQQRKLQQEELKEERLLGGGLLGKRIPEDISREERRRQDQEDRARRADLREAQARQRRGEDIQEVMEEINQRREQRQKVDAIEDRQLRDAERRKLRLEEEELKRAKRRGEDIDELRKKQAEERAKRVDPKKPKEDKKPEPKKPETPEQKIYNLFKQDLHDMKKSLDNIDKSLKCED